MKMPLDWQIERRIFILGKEFDDLVWQNLVIVYEKKKIFDCVRCVLAYVSYEYYIIQKLCPDFMHFVKKLCFQKDIQMISLPSILSIDILSSGVCLFFDARFFLFPSYVILLYVGK